VQVPSTGNDCIAGSCSSHTPLAFGGSVSTSFTTTRSFPNGDVYQIDGMISASENASGTSTPGTIYFTNTFVSGNGTNGTSEGEPDNFLLHSYFDFTANGNAGDLTVVADGSFSSGVGAQSSVQVSAQYITPCGTTSSPVLGPISLPPNSFAQSANTNVGGCSTYELTDTSFTINFRAGTTPGSYIRLGSVVAPSLTGVNTHDFNGDRFSDITWLGAGGALSIWLMNGSAGALGTATGTWSIVGQRDFNGDGKADWLWRDGSGNTVIWFLDGLQAVRLRCRARRLDRG
jgi:hypothetical protein